ncbi:uncharacterized protein LOC106179724 [Lingula anatina]|uniref:Uncharacterized protein LOC106179724 n=1 Tax=Lingula anatina TaxID=7574 RepID=A0A1S3K8X5_LINAN|nr:uncharacterized protein LOC106179724 [Lingula anatina]|eukprot:XP_013418904.1 uncharacterized protein LOC106179724 [Lingula anatina]
MATATARRPVLYLASVIPEIAQTIRNINPNIEVKEVKIDGDPAELSGIKTPPDVLASALKDAEVLLTDPFILGPILYRLPRMKWVMSTWAGPDKVFQYVDQSKPFPDFTLTRFAGKFGPAMAEYVVGNIVARERHFQEMRQDQERCKWNWSARANYRLLSTLSLGILGLGEIGKEVARACQTFGMTVYGAVRGIPEDSNKSPYVSHYKLLSELPEVFHNCDYVCNILPSTPETRGLLNGDVFKHCANKKSVFINVGRGDVVDEDTIVNAISQGWLSGAILDVYPEEPLPASSKLWTCPGVTLSPHVAAVSFGWQVAEVVCENYERYVQGLPLKYQVSWEKGY